MKGVLLAVAIVLANYLWESAIIHRTEKRSGPEGIGYMLKWNSLRIFGLISCVVGVILLANIEVIS
ncbi:MAG: hypothetical protein K8I00_11240, partial [Candidatus Omnitrophica bacterium]|nr:hypothetical protein [Candidatus Omnitrophota bacterium]